jgi:hypothetical protein
MPPVATRRSAFPAYGFSHESLSASTVFWRKHKSAMRERSAEASDSGGRARQWRHASRAGSLPRVVRRWSSAAALTGAQGTGWKPVLPTSTSWAVFSCAPFGFHICNVERGEKVPGEGHVEVHTICKREGVLPLRPDPHHRYSFNDLNGNHFFYLLAVQLCGDVPPTRQDVGKGLC